MHSYSHLVRSVLKSLWALLLCANSLFLSFQHSYPFFPSKSCHCAGPFLLALTALSTLLCMPDQVLLHFSVEAVFSSCTRLRVLLSLLQSLSLYPALQCSRAVTPKKVLRSPTPGPNSALQPEGKDQQRDGMCSM